MTDTTESNRARAARGAHAIRHYAHRHGDTALDELVIDLVADLCHAAHAAGFDPEVLLRVAAEHYTVEDGESMSPQRGTPQPPSNMHTQER